MYCTLFSISLSLKVSLNGLIWSRFMRLLLAISIEMSSKLSTSSANVVGLWTLFKSPWMDGCRPDASTSSSVISSWKGKRKLNSFLLGTRRHRFSAFFSTHIFKWYLRFPRPTRFVAIVFNQSGEWGCHGAIPVNYPAIHRGHCGRVRAFHWGDYQLNTRTNTPVARLFLQFRRLVIVVWHCLLLALFGHGDDSHAHTLIGCFRLTGRATTLFLETR